MEPERSVDLRERLGEIRTATLVVAGADDATTPVAQARQLHAKIPGAALAIIPDAGHWLPIEKPKEACEAIGILSMIESLSAMSGKGFMFRYYDVLLNGTAGCHSLPTIDAVLSDLHKAGFHDVERVRMLSGPGALGLLARRGALQDRA